MPQTATPTYQPHLLDPHSASPQPVSPANGKSFKLAELYQLLDCQTVDVVRLSPELILIIDDEGKFRHPAYLNLLATYLWYQHQPEARGVDSIVGRAIVSYDCQAPGWGFAGQGAGDTRHLQVRATRP
ncbi:DUF3846 domain-containing protein [Hymenobacter sp. BT770]|uniref:DUF3846 domain-containing protein n=1 Tax=Hymenobacter sp. BT770 TaxID=2886942 RepID=UPI001D11AEB5|nr:DUF3846 domain-containing protein [Hymenobacter sp. BT770]MCC3152788.1 DUF3846 domain-containing protein [Hymenobacter sp. BT770]MDO3414863.1 DUF3846 domain-containing protein [Hymenobacter sp. BT770]